MSVELMALKDCLAAVQHSDQQVRRQGELNLSKLFKSSDAIILLIQFACDMEQEVHYRQLSMVLIAQQVHRNWSHFVVHGSVIIEFALRYCHDSVVSIRNSSMVILAKICASGKSGEQDLILPVLVESLRGSNIENVLLGLRSVYVIADEVDDSLNMKILHACYESIATIVQTVDRSQEKLLRYAIRVIRVCAEKISSARLSSGFPAVDLGLGSDLEGVLASVSQFIGAWAPVAFTWIQSCTTPLQLDSSIPILLELIRSLSSIMSSFPEQCEGLFPEAVRQSCRLLATCRDRFLAEISGALIPDEASGYASDGDRQDFQTLILQLFEFLCTGLSEPEGLAAVSGDIHTLSALLLDFMQLTQEEKELFDEDGNEFVASEQDDFMGETLRQRGVELVKELVRSRAVEVYAALFQTAQAEFSTAVDGLSAVRGAALATVTATVAQQQAAQASVYRVEAIVWTLGAVLTAYMKLAKKARSIAGASGRAGDGPRLSTKDQRAIAIVTAFSPAKVAKQLQHLLPFSATYCHLLICLVHVLEEFLDGDWDVAESVGHIVQVLLSPGMPPILQGRAVWLAARSADLFTASVQDFMLSACGQLLGAGNPLSIRLQACRALSKIGYKYPAQGACRAPEFVKQAVEAVLPLLAVTAESTIYYPAEAVFALLRLNVASIALYPDLAASVSQFVVETWSRNASDMLLVDVIADVWKQLLLAPHDSGLYALAEKFIPFARHVLLEVSPELLSGGQTGEPIVDLLATLGSATTRSPALEMTGATASSTGAGGAGAGAGTGTSAELEALKNRIRVEVLSVLVPAIPRVPRSLRQECIQAVNRCFSAAHGNGSTALAGQLSGEVAAQMVQALGTYALGAFTLMEEDTGSQELAGATVGLVCQLMLSFGSGMAAGDVSALVAKMVSLLGNSSSDYVKYSITMGFIHLFARDAQLSARLLSEVPVVAGRGSTLGLMLEQWSALHPVLGSAYCRGISSIGLSKLVALLAQHESNHAFALRVIELLLNTLPSVLRHRENWWKEEDDDDEDGGNDGGKDGDEDSYDSDESGEIDDEDEYEEDDGDDDEDGDFEDDDGADEGDGDAGGFGSADAVKMAGGGRRAKGSPFAPAEMYFLSDMLGDSGGAGGRGGGGRGDPVLANVSPHLVFSPPSRDPLVGMDIEGAMVQFLVQLSSGAVASGAGGAPGFPAWMEGLSPANKRLVQALVASR